MIHSWKTCFHGLISYQSVAGKRSIRLSRSKTIQASREYNVCYKAASNERLKILDGTHGLPFTEKLIGQNTFSNDLSPR